MKNNSIKLNDTSIITLKENKDSYQLIENIYCNCGWLGNRKQLTWHYSKLLGVNHLQCPICSNVLIVLK